MLDLLLLNPKSLSDIRIEIIGTSDPMAAPLALSYGVALWAWRAYRFVRTIDTVYDWLDDKHQEVKSSQKYQEIYHNMGVEEYYACLR